MSFDCIWRNGNIWKSLLHKFIYVPQLLIFNVLVVLCIVCVFWPYLSLLFYLHPFLHIYSSKQLEQITAKMTLKLLQDIGVFNVNVLFTFLNVYSLNSNNESQHSHCNSWLFLTPTSSLLNSALVKSALS